MNCTCAQPTNDCPEHGTGCDGRRYMALKAQRDDLLAELDAIYDAARGSDAQLFNVVKHSEARVRPKVSA